MTTALTLIAAAMPALSKITDSVKSVAPPQYADDIAKIEAAGQIVGELVTAVAAAEAGNIPGAISGAMSAFNGMIALLATHTITPAPSPQ
jgi:hypothetical protein